MTIIGDLLITMLTTLIDDNHDDNCDDNYDDNMMMFFHDDMHEYAWLQKEAATAFFFKSGE